MDSNDLMGRVGALRARGYAPKQIARALGVSPATVAPLIRAIAAADQAGAAEPKLVGCWVSPGWSQGLTVKGHTEWPDVDAADAGAQGLVSVLVTRQERYGRVHLCGWLVDVWCLGVKDVVGPRLMDERRVSQFAGSYFAAYQAPPLAVPVELARHLVFGAVEYARRLGFASAPGFEATAGQLGPWAGPSAIGFGRHGKPFFVQGPRDNAAAILQTLERSVGRDNFHFLARA
jgi:hypothetical protein